VVNKYAILDSLQEESEIAEQWYSEVALSRNKEKCPRNIRKRKIVNIGNSHARGTAVTVSSGLG